MRKSSPFTVLLLMVVIGTAAITAQAQATFAVVYNFGSALNDPLQPFYSGIIAQGRDGNLYSGSNAGGQLSSGAAYKVTPAGTLSTLLSFGTGLGSYPTGGLTLGTDGSFYGTTYGGGFATIPFGTVFKMTPGGGLNTLYVFSDSADGALPTAPPVQGLDGNFYGTTCEDCNGPHGGGTIYKITPAGVFTLLYQFDVTHGFEPRAPLLLGTNGNFYGTAGEGGTPGQGVIFRITPTGVLTDIYNFDLTHGAIPIGPLVQATDGNFYGTAQSGGSHNYGVVFRVTPSGSFRVLHNMNGTSDGGSPSAGLVQATDGNFYGVNIQRGVPSAGCPSGCGTIFKVTPAGVFSTLYSFDLTTGSTPYTTLTQHTNGFLYGTTQLGGTGNVFPCSSGQCGVLYSVNIGAAPFVSLVTNAGRVGKLVEILGQGFLGTTQIQFNGTVAPLFTIVSDTYMTATVPTGATSGFVTVTTSGGALTSSKAFRILP